MPYYRALENLTIKGKIISRNTIFSHQLQYADKLIKQGVIAELNTPPLIELPNWFERAYKLQEINIFMGLDLLEADINRTANLLDLEPSEVQSWKEELISLLTVTDTNKPCCGG